MLCGLCGIFIFILYIYLQEVLIQGNLGDEIADILQSGFGISSKYVQVTDKTEKKKS